METNEISNEIIAKVLSPYRGHKVKDYYNEEIMTLTGISDDGVTITSRNMFKHNRDFKEIKLILKPLQSMSDEDAIEMAKIFGGISGEIILNRPTDLKNKDIHFTVQVYTNKPKFTTYSTPKYLTDSFGYKEYQWLQSKGYDTPHPLLNDKTLEESGLAIHG